MDKGLDLIEALNQISREKGIDKEVIYEAIETSLVSACKKNFGTSQNIKVLVDRDTGDVKVFAQKDVVEEVEDEHLQISLEQAREMNAQYELGDVVDITVTPKNFGRISAQTAKQVVVQKFREAEREILFNEYITKEKDIVTGIVQRKEHKNVYIALGRLDAVLSQNEQAPGEEYRFQDRLKVYVLEVRQTTKGPLVNVSRTHPELVKRLFEQEVPEVHDGVVEIKSIAREAGSRTKIAVYSKNSNVDAVGACVGQNGARVGVVVAELRGEKIDIINWNEEPAKFIAAALSPSKVVEVRTDAADQSATIIVPDNQLSLAIGRDGQNARLAAKLTGWRIDIKSESQSFEAGAPPDAADTDGYGEEDWDDADGAAYDEDGSGDGYDEAYEEGYEETSEDYGEDYEETDEDYEEADEDYGEDYEEAGEAYEEDYEEAGEVYEDAGEAVEEAYTDRDEAP